MITNECPLLTFALFAYNQEKYIAEAVKGALAQTYTPLEIILSDDCSKDATYEIMEAMASNYSGPHTLKLNRNGSNLGIGSHVNKVLSMASGSWIIMAAGDDVSKPDRTASLFQLSLEHSRYKALFSGMEVIGDDGRKIGMRLLPGEITQRHNLSMRMRSWCPGVHGSTSAWHRDLFAFFGALDSKAVTEDRILALRAALLGEIGYSAAPLVSYRRHDNNVSGSPGARTVDELRKHFRRDWSHGEATARSYVKDIDTFIEKNGGRETNADILRVAHVLHRTSRQCVNFADSASSVMKIWFAFSVVRFDYRLTLRMLAIAFAPKLYIQRLSSLKKNRSQTIRS